MTNVRRAVRYAALVLITAVFVTPLVWMALTSLKTYDDAQQDPPSWLPNPFSTYGYDQILGNTANPVLRWFLNSMLAASLHTLLVLVTASMAAVESSKITMPGRGTTPRAMLIRCRWPPESATPRSPTRVS